MVHQPLPDARQRAPHRNAEIAQMAGRPDPRAQQMRRRVDRAGGEDDLVAAEFLLSPGDAP